MRPFGPERKLAFFMRIYMAKQASIQVYTEEMFARQ